MSTMTRPDVVGDAEVSRGALWFGLLGGAVAWLAHLMFAYGIAEFGCEGELSEHSWLGVSAVAWLLLALTAVTALLAAAAAFVAWRSRRRLGPGGGEAATDGRGARVALAWAGLLTSGLFALTIVVESIPIFYYLQTCS